MRRYHLWYCLTLRLWCGCFMLALIDNILLWCSLCSSFSLLSHYSLCHLSSSLSLFFSLCCSVCHSLSSFRLFSFMHSYSMPFSDLCLCNLLYLFDQFLLLPLYCLGCCYCSFLFSYFILIKLFDLVFLSLEFGSCLFENFFSIIVSLFLLLKAEDFLYL